MLAQPYHNPKSEPKQKENNTMMKTALMILALAAGIASANSLPPTPEFSVGNSLPPTPEFSMHNSLPPTPEATVELR